MGTRVAVCGVRRVARRSQSDARARRETFLLQMYGNNSTLSRRDGTTRDHGARASARASRFSR